MALQLRRLGYREVKILKGGLGSWANAGLPLESKPAAGQPPPGYTRRARMREDAKSTSITSATSTSRTAEAAG